MSEPIAGRLPVFVDADVLVAGSRSRTGASHVILQLAELGLIEGISSEQVRGEVERNLASKLPAALPAFELLADAAIRWVKNPSSKEIAKLKGQVHPKDLPILAAALREGCSSLITFNVRDYRPKMGAIQIETPGALLVRLRKHVSDLSTARDS